MKSTGIIAANWQLKLLSLLFAAVLWLFVTLETGDEIEVPLRVKFVNTPAGLILLDGTSKPPSLRIAGPRTLLLRQRWQGVTVELDLAGVRTGKAKFSGLDRHVLLIPGVRPLRVSPAELEISLAAK
jgi:hypothetical protein